MKYGRKSVCGSGKLKIAYLDSSLIPASGADSGLTEWIQTGTLRVESIVQYRHLFTWKKTPSQFILLTLGISGTTIRHGGKKTVSEQPARDTWCHWRVKHRRGFETHTRSREAMRRSRPGRTFVNTYGTGSRVTNRTLPWRDLKIEDDTPTPT